MKHLLLLTLFLPFFGGDPGDKKIDEQNIAVVEQYIYAVENLQFDVMESLLADNYMGLGPSYGDTIYKEQAISSWQHNVKNLYESIKYDRIQNAAVYIKEGPSKGHWVSSWAELTIVYQFGNTVKIWANTAYKVEKGQIVKSLTFYNEADVYRKLGYEFIDTRKQ
jgi:hypothetical protein